MRGGGGGGMPTCTGRSSNSPGLRKVPMAGSDAAEGTMVVAGYRYLPRMESGREVTDRDGPSAGTPPSAEMMPSSSGSSGRGTNLSLCLDAGTGWPGAMVACCLAVRKAATAMEFLLSPGSGDVRPGNPRCPPLIEPCDAAAAPCPVALLACCNGGLTESKGTDAPVFLLILMKSDWIAYAACQTSTWALAKLSSTTSRSYARLPTGCSVQGITLGSEFGYLMLGAS
mmetsp:Transcript_22848/g.58203  ORF Transcript_22848/g.58203 Transcript_22848/m.58203 type:complete len:227 (+) Transcript_22848:1370-2050(+)